jgi:hypothetical protein
MRSPFLTASTARCVDRDSFERVMVQDGLIKSSGAFRTKPESASAAVRSTFA